MSTEATDNVQFRKKRINQAIVFAFGSKVCGFLVTLLTIPMAVATLGAEQFGAYITITSMFALLGFLDGGIGNALINQVAHCRARNQIGELNRNVASAFFSLLIFAVVFLACTIPLVILINWRWLLNLPEAISSNDIAYSVLVSAIAFAIMLPLSVAIKTQQGLQETHHTQIVNIVSHLLRLAAVSIAAFLKCSLPVFLFAFAIVPAAAALLNTFYLFFFHPLISRPRWAFVTWSTSKSLLSVGGLFFCLQACVAIAFNSDAIIIARFADLKGVSEYGIAFRLYGIITTVAGLVTIPLWPAFRDACSRGEMPWVRSTFTKCLIVVVGISVPSTSVVCLFHQPILRLWIGTSIQPSFSMMLAMLVWVNFLCIGQVLSVLLNAMQIVKLQLVLSISMALVNIALSIWLTRYYGAIGVVLGSIVSYGILVLLPYCILLPGLLRKDWKEFGASTTVA